jgi:hypothetical protein
VFGFNIKPIVINIPSFTGINPFCHSGVCPGHDFDTNNSNSDVSNQKEECE